MFVMDIYTHARIASRTLAYDFAVIIKRDIIRKEKDKGRKVDACH